MPNNDEVGEEENSERNDTKHDEEEEEEEEKGGEKNCGFQKPFVNCKKMKATTMPNGKAKKKAKITQSLVKKGKEKTKLAIQSVIKNT